MNNVNSEKCYCEECGREKVKRMRRVRFNRLTGKPEMWQEWICPSWWCRFTDNDSDAL